MAVTGLKSLEIWHCLASHLIVPNGTFHLLGLLGFSLSFSCCMTTSTSCCTPGYCGSLCLTSCPGLKPWSGGCWGLWEGVGWYLGPTQGGLGSWSICPAAVGVVGSSQDVMLLPRFPALLPESLLTPGLVLTPLGLPLVLVAGGLLGVGWAVIGTKLCVAEVGAVVTLGTLAGWLADHWRDWVVEQEGWWSSQAQKALG